MFSRILVGTDGSESATLAVEHAAELARALGSDLTVVCAYRDQAPAPGPLSGRGARTSPDAAEAVARHALRRVEGVSRLLTVTGPGEPSAVVADLALRSRADLVVVGNRGMAGFGRVRGSVPNDVSHHVRAAVLIADTAHERPPGYRRILVGTDGSPTAAKAVSCADRLAEELGAKLTIASVGRSVADAERVLEPLWHRHPMAERLALAGAPAAELVRVADEGGFDLIVVGNRGMHGARRLLGSVPDAISHRAPTNVLIVDTGSASHDGGDA